MNETPKTKSGWRILRWILISLAVLATVIALFYTEEDWRGKRDWEAYKHKWEAKGEKFDWQAFIPPSVPDDQNFFNAPIFTNMVDGKIVMVPYGNDGGPDVPRDARRSGYAVYLKETTDLQAWQSYYRHQTNTETMDRFPIAPQPQTPAKDVLLALSKYNSAIEELRQASQRPYSNIPLNYENGFNAIQPLLVAYLPTLKRCSQTLQLRASAELANGQNAKSLDDVTLLLHLSNSLRTSPFLISALVRFAIVDITLQPVWEGLAEHKWSDEQLATLERELAKIDFLADYEFTMRGERAFAIATIKNEQRTRELISLGGNGYITNRLTLVPSGFFYQNELAFARMSQRWILPLVDTNSDVVSPEALRRADAAVHAEMKHYSPYTVQALMTFPALENAVRRFAVAQTFVDLARVACALGRYRLAHGEYPETLDMLAPKFIEKLPHDIINGQPLHYRRTDDGKFVLYSVGWDGKDDGGTVALTKGDQADIDKGDWVWQYPAK
jgi:hypothetical protein